MDLRQTPQYSEYLKSLNWIVEEIDGVYYFIKKIWLFGSVIKAQRPKKFDSTTIEQLAKKYRVFQVILEPTLSTVFNSKMGFHINKKNLALGSCVGTKNRSSSGVWAMSNVHKLIIQHGYKLAKSSYLPTKTTVIDLKKSLTKMLQKMHHKTRYNIKKSCNLQLTTYNSKDILSFADFWQSCALKQRGMYLSQKKEIIALYKAFEKNCSIIFVFPPTTYNLKPTTFPLASVFSVYSKDTAFYMYAAATPEGKKRFAPTLAAWESIKLAKKRHLKYHDFEGVFDERFPLPSWKGFSRFKLSFGGKVVEYPGSYVKFRLPV